MAKTHDSARARLAYLQAEAAGLAVAMAQLRRAIQARKQAQLDKETAA